MKELNKKELVKEVCINALSVIKENDKNKVWDLFNKCIEPDTSLNEFIQKNSHLIQPPTKKKFIEKQNIEPKPQYQQPITTNPYSQSYPMMNNPYGYNNDQSYMQMYPPNTYSQPPNAYGQMNPNDYYQGYQNYRKGGY